MYLSFNIVAIYIYMLLVRTTKASRCGTPFGPVEKCYWILSSGAASQLEAEDSCQANDGQLAHVDTPEVSQFLSAHLEIRSSDYTWVCGVTKTSRGLGTLSLSNNIGFGEIDENIETCSMVDDSWMTIESNCITDTKYSVICESITDRFNKSTAMPVLRRKGRSAPPTTITDDCAALESDDYTICPSSMVAIQKSTWDGNHAELALDNITSTCGATGFDSSPWWRVQFETPCRIQKLKMCLRVKHCGKEVSVKVLLANKVDDRDHRRLEDVHYGWVTVKTCTHNAPMFLEIDINMDAQSKFMKLEFLDPSERFIQVDLCEVRVYGY